MTYNQVVEELRSKLSSHAMIKTVRFDTPQEWINPLENKDYPIAFFAINNFSLNRGREQEYSVTLWFLDKSGDEGVFDTEVSSDMHSICADIISTLRKESNPYSIDDNISGEVVSGKFEDYLTGVQTTFNISTTSDFDACDMPTI